MGINLNAGFMKILEGRRSYKEFENKSFLMLGKQTVNFNRGKLRTVFDSIGFEYKPDVIHLEDGFKNIDSYDLFLCIGFKEVKALDISDYEGANIIADLTDDELPADLIERFDYIFDGGTLQHIFNLPKAIVNVNKMLKTGGHIIHDLICANYVDFAFYSVSPTAITAFYMNNGYLIHSIFLFGYRHPQSKDLNIISPDCRLINSGQWVNVCAKDFKVLCVCDAEKTKAVDEYTLSFPQPLFDDLWHRKQNVPLSKRIYEKAWRLVKMVKDA